jgi:signal transduction histidine kinase
MDASATRDRPSPLTQETPAIALPGGAMVLCLFATAVVMASPRLLFGVHDPALHLVLDTVDACVAVLVAYLLIGRYRRDHSARSLLLAGGLLLLAAANLVGGLVAEQEEYTVRVWLAQSMRVAGALLVLGGAVVRSRRWSGRRARWVGLATLVVLGCTSLAIWLWRHALPIALTSAPVSAQDPTITGHPALIVSHLLGGICFLAAAVTFTVDARRTDDEMLRWLGAACVLGAFSRVHYMLFPSIYSGWLYTGDVLRTGCYLLLLVGAAREIGQYWVQQPRLAVVADRRRLARELHDGVVQELGFIRSEAHGLADADASHRISESARRGLEEARAAVEELDRGDDETFSLQLHRVARELGEQYGAHVVVDLDVSVRVDRVEAHDLVRIAREAIGNAVRHGGAEHVIVGLTRDQDGRRLVVHDDGSGFDPEVGTTGYGLTSMRDRAAGLPGELTIRSTTGRGTTVTVSW